MANTATVTAKTGPAIQATSLVLTGVTIIDFNLGASVLEVTCDQGRPRFSLTGSNTITLTAVANSYTLTVS